MPLESVTWIPLRNILLSVVLWDFLVYLSKSLDVSGSIPVKDKYNPVVLQF